MNIYKFIPDIFGTAGVILIQVYYFLLQTHRCKSDDLSFLLANFFGSIFLLISLWFDWNLYAIIIEISWLAISTYGIWGKWHTKNKDIPT